MLILETLRLHSGYLGHHFGDPRVQGDTWQDTLGPDVDFYDFFMDSGVLLGSSLDSVL